MRIAYLLGSLNTGGTEKFLLDVFQNAPEQNLDIVIIYRKGGQLENDFILSGQPIYKLGPKHRFDILYLLRLRHLLQAEKIEIAHAHQALDALLVKFASIGLSITVILTIHGFDYSLSRFAKRIQKYALKLADRCIFVSEFQRIKYSEKFDFINRKSFVVYNGLSFKSFNEKMTISLYNEFKISENVFLMGSVGNFVAGRNPLFICKFLKTLKDCGINFNFIFVGKKDEKEPWRYDECVEFCRTNGLTNVFFPGSRNDVPAIVKQFDAFIYYSDHDTFGMAVIEAIAAGVPVFVNDWDVMLEITENGRFANIFHSNEELLDMILKFLQNKNLFIEKSFQASLKAKEKFSIKKHLEVIQSVYNQLN